MTLLLGIDIGTSSAKAVLYDPDQAAILAAAGHEYPVHRPAPDRAEQNPDDWWNATREVVRRVLAEAGRRDVVAIGLCGQMHGLVLLDAQGESLAPAIIWPDQRSAAEVRDLIDTVSAERYAQITGTLPATGFLGPSLLWVARHQPELLQRTHRVVLPKDSVRARLTGEICTDVSDAASTALFDVAAKRWSAAILHEAGLPLDLFPPALDSFAIAGQLTAEAAAQLGLPAGVEVVAGCADQPAQAIANGLIAPGKVSITVGSGGQVLVPLRPEDGRLATDPRVHVFNHAAPGTWYVLGAILSAGLSLRWLRGVTGLNGREDAYAVLSAEAAQTAPGAEGLLFLPYLSGERTPHMDPLARGAFIGLSAYHERGHLVRAVMEGVAFALRQTLDISLKLGGRADMVIAAGGGMESGLWRGIMADVLGLPLQRTLMTEQTGVGAALLAGVGVGLYGDLDEASRMTARYDDSTEPDTQRHDFYRQRYEQFIGLYPRLRSDFYQLAGF